MKKITAFIFLLGIMLLVFSCKDKSGKEQEKEITVVEDTVNYYPVNFFLVEDIRAVVLSGAKIYKTISINKAKSDSVLIDTAEFNALAKRFLEKDITESSVKRFYRESVFNSIATNSITFNYTSLNPALDIKTVNANVTQDDHKLKRVDIRVISTKNDSTFTENYSWLPGTKFYITNYAEGKDRKGVSSITTVTWHK